MRYDEPELMNLRADMASTRFEFALVQASVLETKLQAAAAIERVARRADFEARASGSKIEANRAMLLERLGVIPAAPHKHSKR